MKIYDRLYKHLNHLISTLPACNFIPWDDKKDLVQDVIFIIHKKIEEGVLVEDFDEIKGYVFISVQNSCRAFHRKEMKRETPVAEFWEIEDFSNNMEDEEYKEYLHRIVKSFLSQTKYSEDDKRVGELLLSSLDDKEIREITGLDADTLKKIKFRIKVKMKFDYRRELKYIIRHIENKNLMVPCYNVADAKNYLSHINPRSITYMINNEGWTSPDGHYIQVLVKPKKRKKKNA